MSDYPPFSHTQDDEISAQGADLHMERMDDDDVWFALRKNGWTLDCHLVAQIKWFPWPRPVLTWVADVVERRPPETPTDPGAKSDE